MAEVSSRISDIDRSSIVPFRGPTFGQEPEPHDETDGSEQGETIPEPERTTEGVVQWFKDEILRQCNERGIPPELAFTTASLEVVAQDGNKVRMSYAYITSGMEEGRASLHVGSYLPDGHGISDRVRLDKYGEPDGSPLDQSMIDRVVSVVTSEDVEITASVTFNL